MRTKILAVLAEASEPLDIQAIAEGTGAQVKSVSEALSRLNKDEFVDNPEKGFWQIKDEGRQELNRIREQEARSLSKNPPNYMEKWKPFPCSPTFSDLLGRS